MKCSVAAQYLVYLCHVIIVAVGVTDIILSTGILQNYFESGAIAYYPQFGQILLITGFIIILTAFFGVMATTAENVCGLITYGILLISLSVLHMAAGIIALKTAGKREIITNYFNGHLMTIFAEYFNYETFTKWIDDLQQMLKCCGVYGPNYWQDHFDQLPRSCCDVEICNFTNAYQKKCTEACANYLINKLKAYGKVTVTFSVVEFITAIIFFINAAIVKEKRKTDIERDPGPSAKPPPSGTGDKPFRQQNRKTNR